MCVLPPPINLFSEDLWCAHALAGIMNFGAGRLRFKSLRQHHMGCLLATTQQLQLQRCTLQIGSLDCNAPDPKPGGLKSLACSIM